MAEWASLPALGPEPTNVGPTGGSVEVHAAEYLVEKSGAEVEIPIQPELRAALGLEDNEFLRVAQSGPHVISFERFGGEGGSPVPWDRDLVLTAEVRAFPMAELLSMIHRGGKSGFVLFNHEGHEKCVYLHRGEVVFASSNQRIDRIGECLLRSGAVTLEQLNEADRRWRPNSRFGKVLVDLGLLTPRDLWNAVKSQVEDIVRSLFAYTAGTVYFWHGDVQPDNIVRLALPTSRLIAEGLNRRDELFGFLAVLEDPRTTLRMIDGSKARLPISEQMFLDALETDIHFGPLCRRVGIDPLSAARTLQMLQLSGAIRVDQHDAMEEAARTAHSQDEELLRECVQNHVKLLAELAAPIVAVDGPDEVGARLGRVVEEAAARHPELLAGLAVAPGGMLDPEEILQRSLRQTTERSRGVCDALGELVAYLEFELMNHPKIEDAEMFLEAVEGLRQQLGP
jgi:hypothetical protein